MLILGQTSVVRIVTGSAAQIEVHASVVDISGDVVSIPDPINTPHITAATTTIVVPSPAASTKRNVKGLSIRNDHASQSCTVTVEHFDGTTAIELVEWALTPQQTLTRSEGGVWSIFGGTGQDTNVQIFNGVGGTWTKPLGAKIVIVEIIGGGGGGGGGASLATAVVAKGGGGGGGGAYANAQFNAADLGPTEAVTIGGGGAGGNAGLAGAAGGSGGIGGNSSFGAWITAFGGGGGAGGAISAAITGGGGGRCGC